jgi:hypothetical protein
MGCNEHPNNEPSYNNDACNWWDKENLRGSSDESGCAFHDSYSNSDVLLVTDGANEKHSTNSCHGVATIEIIWILLILFVHSLRCLPKHESTISSGNNHSQNREINDWTST